MRHEPKPYRALALDGGGFRGLYTATVLNEIGSFFALHRHDSDLDLGRRFDLISGTSTGGILACGLAAGISTAKIIRLYEEFGPKIFTNPLPANGLAKLGWFRRSATQAANKAEPLKQGLLEIFGRRTIGDMFAERGIALCIPSIKMLNQTPKVFKTNHRQL
jgi:uncharacterized protein